MTRDAAVVGEIGRPGQDDDPTPARFTSYNRSRGRAASGCGEDSGMRDLTGMKKPPLSSGQARRESTRPRSGSRHEADISAGLERLDDLKPESAEAVGLIGLLRSWLADESGYDEQTWPGLKKGLDQERRRIGARRLFDD
jgi:hypothetical protein